MPSGLRQPAGAVRAALPPRGAPLRVGRAAVWKVVGCSLSAASQVFRCPPVGRISKGWGIRSPELIPRGSFVCEYVGEYISDDEAESRGIRYDNQKMSRLMDVCTDALHGRGVNGVSSHLLPMAPHSNGMAGGVLSTAAAPLSVRRRQAAARLVPTSTGCSRGAEACRFGHVTRAARCLSACARLA